MWIAVPFIIIGAVQTFRQWQDSRISAKTRVIARLEEQADLYGRLWGRMLISRQMYIDFTDMEGWSYPEEFGAFVDAIDADPQSPLAERYRAMMKDVLGPIQLECLDLIMNKKWLFKTDGAMADLLLEYMLMASSYKIIFLRWENGDYNVQFSRRRFPPELIECLQNEYLETKRELEVLLLKSRGKPKATLHDKLSGSSPSFKPQYVEDKKKRPGSSSKIPNSRNSGFKSGSSRL